MKRKSKRHIQLDDNSPDEMADTGRKLVCHCGLQGADVIVKDGRDADNLREDLRTGKLHC